MDYSTYGTGYDEKLKIMYNDKVIYHGYVDDLITSEDNETDINFRLNFDLNLHCNVIARKYGNNILWIPNPKYCFKEEYKYIPIVSAYSELDEIWKAIGYDFENDFNIIPEASDTEILLTWFITSGIRSDSTDISSIAKDLSRKYICTNKNDESIEQCIVNLFNYDNRKVKIDIVNVSNIELNLVEIYMDGDIIWNGIKTDSNNNIYLNISDGIYLPVIYNN